MENVIRVRIKAISNLFIGGSPQPFEIGGIDQWTAVDEEGFPCIPASSFKGALRTIVMKDRSDEASEIAQWYREFLKREQDELEEKIPEFFDAEMKERVKKRYADAVKHASACDLFGIREFNNTPKLLFNDLKLSEEYRDLKKCFSIDTKAAIDCGGKEPKSNPRTYKAVKQGVEFEGEIEFYGFEDREKIERCKTYLKKNLQKFNTGIYRLGNSKSRGYGKIFVITEDGSGEREKL